MTEELLECLHCGHKWKPNKLSNGFPKCCPECKSYKWGEYSIRDFEDIKKRRDLEFKTSRQK
jgi:predicted Zn-ribbon and HTH transcriptional regulator